MINGLQPGSHVPADMEVFVQEQQSHGVGK